jgi:hypothetical protein
MTNGWVDIKNTDMMLVMGGNARSGMLCKLDRAHADGASRSLHQHRAPLDVAPKMNGALDWLHVEWAIYMVSSFHLTRSARLGMSHPITLIGSESHSRRRASLNYRGHLRWPNSSAPARTHHSSAGCCRIKSSGCQLPCATLAHYCVARPQFSEDAARRRTRQV